MSIIESFSGAIYDVLGCFTFYRIVMKGLGLRCLSYFMKKEKDNAGESDWLTINKTSTHKIKNLA